MMMQVIFLVVN